MMRVRVWFCCALAALMGVTARVQAGMCTHFGGGIRLRQFHRLTHLKGPANDVRRPQCVLDERGVTNITFQADGITDVPTRGNILMAMADLAARSGVDDLVYVHLSGHGTYQPAP